MIFGHKWLFDKRPFLKRPFEFQGIFIIFTRISGCGQLKSLEAASSVALLRPGDVACLSGGALSRGTEGEKHRRDAKGKRSILWGRGPILTHPVMVKQGSHSV